MDTHHDPDKLLNSLEGIQKAQAPPFFYGKLLSRMQQGIPEEPVRRPFVLRPALVVALSVFLLLNIFLLVQPRKSQPQPKEQPATIESFASAYGLGTSSVY